MRVCTVGKMQKFMLGRQMQKNLRWKGNKTESFSCGQKQGDFLPLVHTEYGVRSFLRFGKQFLWKFHRPEATSSAALQPGKQKIVAGMYLLGKIKHNLTK